MEMEVGRVYIAEVLEIVGGNQVSVRVESNPAPHTAILSFPYYHVEYSEPDNFRFGYGIVYAPEIQSKCLVSLLEGINGTDLYVVGFAPPMNPDESFDEQEIIDNLEDVDKSLTDSIGANSSDFIENINGRQQKNADAELPHAPSYGHRDEDFTQGDIGLVGKARNKIIAYSFGASLIQATSFCFRLYQRFNNTIKEAFRSRFAYFPNGVEVVSNDQAEGSDYIKRIKHNFEDDVPIYERSIGEKGSGFTETHKAKEGDGTITKTIDLETIFTKTYKPGGKTPTVESVGKNGRGVSAFKHTLSAETQNNISGSLVSVSALLNLSLSGLVKASISGMAKTDVSAGGNLNMQGKATTSLSSKGPLNITGQVINLLGPAAPTEKAKGAEKQPDGKSVEVAEKTPPKDALGNVKQAKENAVNDVTTKVKDGQEKLGSKVAEAKAKVSDGVKGIMDKTVGKIGAKAITKFNKIPGSAAIKSKVKDKLKDKVAAFAAEKGYSAEWTTLTQGRMDSIIDKYSPADFGKLSNSAAAPGIQKFLKSNVTDQEARDAVSGDDAETFKEDNMGDLTKNHVKPLLDSKIGSMTQDDVDENCADVIAERTFGNHFDPDTSTGLQSRYSDNTPSIIYQQ